MYVKIQLKPIAPKEDHVKKLLFACFLVAILIVASACVPPPGPRVRGGYLLPPPLIFPAPPLLAFWPDYDVYISVNISADLVFYKGAWYRRHGGNWYRAGGHNGPWRFVPPGQVPKSLRGLPGDLKQGVRGRNRVKHKEMEKNWRQWEKQGKAGHGPEQREDKLKEKKENQKKENKKKKGKKYYDGDEYENKRGQRGGGRKNW